MPKLKPGRSRVPVNLSLNPSTVDALERIRVANHKAIQASGADPGTRSGTVEFMVKRWDPQPPPPVNGDAA